MLVAGAYHVLEKAVIKYHADSSLKEIQASVEKKLGLYELKQHDNESLTQLALVIRKSRKQ